MYLHYAETILIDFGFLDLAGELIARKSPLVFYWMIL
jgi:hypothetical protein